MAKLVRPSQVASWEDIEEAYADMRRKAHWIRRKLNYRGASVQTTDLTNTVVEKLLRSEAATWNDAGHLLALFARKANFVLIDHIRSKTAQVHGGPESPASLESILESRDIPDQLRADPDAFILVENLIRRLEHAPEFPRARERMVVVVRLRVNYGFTMAEAAEILGCSAESVKNDWRRARDWMRDRLTEDNPAQVEDPATESE